MFHADTLSRRKWQEFFEDFSYKPNWEFEFVDEVEYGTSKVIITMRVPDSRNPRRLPDTWVDGTRTQIPLVPITMTVMLEPFHSEQFAKEYIRFHIRDMEEHEVDEWFRYKGELVFDPHKEDR